jgi:hypothetical protein
MPTYTPTYTRSPRILSQLGAVDEEVVVNLHIWNSPDSEPVAPSKILSKSIPSTTVTTVYFDISPYLAEFISFDGYSSVTTETAAPVTEYCYCTAYIYKEDILQDTLYFVAFEGYG